MMRGRGGRRRHQYNNRKTVNIQNKSISSDKIFQNKFIWIDGYTEPSPSQLTHIIESHGGRVTLQYPGMTRLTHIIATALPRNSAIQHAISQGKLRVVNANWILESIKARKLLPTDSFLLPTNSTNSNHLPSTSNDSNFLKHFYNSSRLHFISIWKQKLPSIVNKLQQEIKKPIYDFVYPLSSSRQSCNNKSRNNFISHHHPRVVMHIDIDCFFVSVALRYGQHPELVDKPIAICHAQGKEGSHSAAEIASCNYLAREKKVKNGMYLQTAKRLCPNLITLPYQFEDYEHVSKEVYRIFLGFTSCIQPVSIDEAFLEFPSDTNGMLIGEQIRAEVLSKTGVNVSVGVGSNILFARLACRKAKPNGCFVADETNAVSLLNECLVRDLPGVGHSLENDLHELGIKTCAQLANFPLETLKSSLGDKTAEKIWNLAHGKDDRLLKTSFELLSERQQVGTEISWGIRFKSREQVLVFLEQLCIEVSHRLKECPGIIRANRLTIKMKIRSPNARIEPIKPGGCGQCDDMSRSIQILRDEDLLTCSKRLFLSSFSHVDPQEIRGLGLSLKDLEKNSTTCLQEGQRTLSQLGWSKNKETTNDSSQQYLPPLSQLDHDVLKELPPDVVRDIKKSYDRRDKLRLFDSKTPSNTIFSNFHNENSDSASSSVSSSSSSSSSSLSAFIHNPTSSLSLNLKDHNPTSALSLNSKDHSPISLLSLNSKDHNLTSALSLNSRDHNLTSILSLNSKDHNLTSALSLNSRDRNLTSILSLNSKDHNPTSALSLNSKDHSPISLLSLNSRDLNIQNLPDLSEIDFQLISKLPYLTRKKLCDLYVKQAKANSKNTKRSRKRKKVDYTDTIMLEGHDDMTDNILEFKNNIRNDTGKPMSFWSTIISFCYNDIKKGLDIRNDFVNCLSLPQSQVIPSVHDAMKLSNFLIWCISFRDIELADLLCRNLRRHSQKHSYIEDEWKNFFNTSILDPLQNAVLNIFRGPLNIDPL